MNKPTVETILENKKLMGILLSLASNFAKQGEQPQDLMQDLFTHHINAYRVSKYNKARNSSFEAYIYLIAKNYFIERTQKKQVPLNSYPDLPEAYHPIVPSSSVDAELELSQEANAFRAYLLAQSDNAYNKPRAVGKIPNIVAIYDLLLKRIEDPLIENEELIIRSQVSPVAFYNNIERIKKHARIFFDLNGGYK